MTNATNKKPIRNPTALYTAPTIVAVVSEDSNPERRSEDDSGEGGGESRDERRGDGGGCGGWARSWRFGGLSGADDRKDGDEDRHESHE